LIDELGFQYCEGIDKDVIAGDGGPNLDQSHPENKACHDTCKVINMVIITRNILT
jgi:hypothetical protein